MGTSFGGGSQVGLPAQVQRDPPEALPVARSQPLALDRHRPLEGDVGKIVEAAITRLIGAVLLEQNDEWQLQHRYMQAEGMAELATPQLNELTTPLPTPHAA